VIKLINSLKIKGRMAENQKTFQQLATKVNCTPYTLGRKVANKVPMTLEEANILAIELKITDEEFGEFFLQKELQNATK
jgi:hypothetical protein